MLDYKKILNPEVKELRNFGLGLSILASLIFGYFDYKSMGSIEKYYAFATVFIIAFVAPKFLKVIYIPWMSIAFVINKVITFTVVTLTYWIVFTPFAFLFRLFSKKQESSSYSYRVEPDQRLDFNTPF